ncbi:glutamate--tRNA ligase [Nocardioides sp. zg-578]|uniref:Glutamate--tRNA ligase n=2 Tax=Nocardioides marmotae TaxID=2663857 RepID=A0A6I3JBA5_9ACTN|nr:glutamate--tRNA ligase [Nocardioides marmotae]MCR6031746.1 glutamate--tRNA ligase [Gordonia jinghuaiqii]MTB86156.1 glutamate--tRNA ligase [Nocardioides marmotae]MTB95385.1 glutamate--tRNA ligase [Nocardioides marmotae]QKE00831.1 glutamate--tRNA ligase [Nocardioides marmotae]
MNSPGSTTPVRVRMAPSPTGSPHVGLARTALYNWAFARRHGGTFVFRIEDTDKERNTQESYDSLIDLMQWLGLSWDEGVIVGGPHGPYRQSERGDIYADVLARLRESSYTYDCFCTTEEVEARRKASGSKVMGYDGFCRELSAEQRSAFEAEGRAPVVRFRMPDGEITFDDLVRGEITFQTEHVPDFALARANGDPLYTLTAPVDDATMEITHVLRGEDLLSSTPRQIALFEGLKAIGVATTTPAYGHLPYVMGEGNKKLSKRDPQAHMALYREQGFLAEGLLNYLALLGWSIAPDRDVFTLAEMVEAFDIKDVNPNPARFDLKKAEAINAAQMRLLSIEEITERALPFLAEAGVVDVTSAADRQLLDLAMPLVAERINKLTEAVDMLGFLFVAEEDFTRDEADAAKLLDEKGVEVVRAAYDAVEPLGEWSTAAIQEALQASLVEQLGLKPRNAFGPVRVAVTGRRISPPLFESMELLGRERSLARLRSALG